MATNDPTIQKLQSDKTPKNAKYLNLHNFAHNHLMVIVQVYLFMNDE